METPKHIYHMVFALDGKNHQSSCGLRRDGRDIRDFRSLSKDELRFIHANLHAMSMQFLRDFLPEDNAEIERMTEQAMRDAGYGDRIPMKPKDN